MSGELKCGDKILLSGVVYTARDAAHKRFNALLDEGKELPIPLKDAVIYYAGPTPAPEGKPIGSCGPTTSGRMDRFAPRLLDLGLGGMIGIEFVKDKETKEPAPELTATVINECAKNGSLVEGAGAYNNVIRFLAPLVITDEQLAAGLDIFEKAVVTAMEG